MQAVADAFERCLAAFPQHISTGDVQAENNVTSCFLDAPDTPFSSTENNIPRQCLTSYPKRTSIVDVEEQLSLRTKTAARLTKGSEVHCGLCQGHNAVFAFTVCRESRRQYGVARVQCSQSGRRRIPWKKVF